MSIADMLAIISGLVILGFAFPSLLLIINLVFPHLVNTSKQQIVTKPIANTFQGLAIFLVYFFALAIFINIPGPGKLLALVIFLIMLSIAMIGFAGLVSHLAAKYQDFSKSNKSVTNLFYSAFFLELTFVLPFIGWFIMLPITFLMSLTAGTKALIQNSKSLPVVTSSSPELI